jgi:tyrosyl-tRNA synthetase
MKNPIDLIALEQDLTKQDRSYADLSADEQFQVLSERSEAMVDPERLKKQLTKTKLERRQLRVKYGIDPTTNEAHLGHVVPIIVARRFLQMGHYVTIVIGDFTARVGDPTGRVATRPVLTEVKIKEHVALYREQIGKFIDVNKVEIVYNSRFYEAQQMNVAELFRLYSKIPVAALLQRDDFRKRQDHGLTVAELLYPTLMAIDSIKLGCDVELGGIDQLLNFQVTKELMRREDVEPQTAVTTPLLLSPAGDGKKMSKSANNYISLTATADEAYGKLMSLPDSLMEHYFKLLTDISNEQWQGVQTAVSEDTLNPMVVKRLLARIIITWLHDADAAQQAEEKFSAVFSNRQVPEDVRQEKVQWHDGLNWLELAMQLNLTSSKAAFRRLVEGGAVKLVDQDGITTHLKDITAEMARGTFTIRYGRGKFIKIEVVE